MSLNLDLSVFETLLKKHFQAHLDLSVFETLLINQFQAQLVSLNLERNQISSVRLATLAGLSSLYSLSLAGHDDHVFVFVFVFVFGWPPWPDFPVYSLSLAGHNYDLKILPNHHNRSHHFGQVSNTFYAFSF